MSSPSCHSSPTPRPPQPSISAEKLVKLTPIMPYRHDLSLTPIYAKDRESPKTSSKMKGTTRSAAPQADTQRSRQSQDSANRKDNTLCTPTNVPTATVSIAPPASPPFHHPCDLSGTKTRSRRSFNTTRACSGSTRGGGKDSTVTACSATPTKKSNSD